MPIAAIAAPTESTGAHRGLGSWPSGVSGAAAPAMLASAPRVTAVMPDRPRVRRSPQERSKRRRPTQPPWRPRRARARSTESLRCGATRWNSISLSSVSSDTRHEPPGLDQFGPVPQMIRADYCVATFHAGIPAGAFRKQRDSRLLADGRDATARCPARSRAPLSPAQTPPRGGGTRGPWPGSRTPPCHTTPPSGCGSDRRRPTGSHPPGTP